MPLVAPPPSRARSAPSAAPAPKLSPRAALAGVVLLVTMLGAFDVWAAGPFVRNELARLEPWKVCLLCAGDAIAAAWFIWIALVHLVIGKPLEDRQPGSRAGREIAWFVFSMAAGLAVDLAFTLYLHHEEFDRYDAATSATAQVHGYAAHLSTEGRNYELQCEWRDPATRKTFRGALRIHADGGRSASDAGLEAARLARLHHLVPTEPIGGFPPDLPWATALALATDKPPATVPIRYDPTFPARAWIEGIPDDENGMFPVSLIILFVQMWVVAIAALMAWGRASAQRGSRTLPWWVDLGKVIPTAAEVAIVALMQIFVRLIELAQS